MNRNELIRAMEYGRRISGYEAALAVLPTATDNLYCHNGMLFFYEEEFSANAKIMVEVDTRINAVFLTTQLNHPCYGGKEVVKTRDIYHIRKGKAAFMHLIQELTSCP